MQIRIHATSWKRNLLLLLLLIVGLSVAIPSLLIYRKAKALLLEEVQRKARNTAAVVAMVLSQNVARYQEVSEATELPEGSEAANIYENLNTMLRTVKQQSDVDCIYTMKYLNEEAFRFVLSGELPTSVLFFQFGSDGVMDDAALLSFLTGESTVTNLRDDPLWGVSLSAYAAITSPRDGTILGVVGVDYAEDHLLEMYERLKKMHDISFSLYTILFSIGLYFLIIIIHGRSGIDELTQLGNKRAFNKMLKSVWEEARKHNQNFVLCMIDVDYFKAINDTFGHPVGDIVLSQIGRTLYSIVGKGSQCYRYGGDEFTLILPGTTLWEAARLKQVLCMEVEALTIPELNGSTLSLSIGMAEWVPGITPETLLDMADKDLYAQKRKRG